MSVVRDRKCPAGPLNGADQILCETGHLASEDATGDDILDLILHTSKANLNDEISELFHVSC